MSFPFRFLNPEKFYLRIIFLSLQIIILTFTLMGCAPEKTEVTEQDIHRLIERISYVRFSDRIENEDITKIKTDREHFMEACEIYRLNPDLVLEKLKTTRPELYARFKEKNEK